LKLVQPTCFAEVHLSPGAPNLHFGDVVDIVRHGDGLVELVAYDFQTLEQVCVPVRIHDLPMWRRCVGYHEIVRERQDVLSALNGVCDGAFVGFAALLLTLQSAIRDLQ
jgi:hypothetical protein